jgi:protein-S-isoprenylcysteine O-methyltransferase Ste14
MSKGFIIVILLWISYFIIHSFFASNAVKQFFERKHTSLYKYYRITYVSFAVGFLLFILFFQSAVNHQYFYQRNTISTLIGLILATWGLLIIKSAFKFYDMKEFLGFQQLRGDLEEQAFLRAGILNLVRHPIYTGTILLLAGYFIFDPSLVNLVTVLCMFAYILIGIKLEEKKLLKRFGDQYKKYQDDVPMLFPNLKQLRKFFNGSLTL